MFGRTVVIVLIFSLPQCKGSDSFSPQQKDALFAIGTDTARQLAAALETPVTAHLAVTPVFECYAPQYNAINIALINAGLFPEKNLVLIQQKAYAANNWGLMSFVVNLQEDRKISNNNDCPTTNMSSGVTVYKIRRSPQQKSTTNITATSTAATTTATTTSTALSTTELPLTVTTLYRRHQQNSPQSKPFDTDPINIVETHTTIQSHQRFDVLHEALASNESVSMILDTGMQIKATHLFCALVYQHTKALDEFKNRGIDPFMIPTTSGPMPTLHTFIGKFPNHHETIEWLLKNGADPYEKVHLHAKTSPLYNAFEIVQRSSFRKNPTVLLELLEKYKNRFHEARTSNQQQYPVVIIEPVIFNTDMR